MRREPGGGTGGVQRKERGVDGGWVRVRIENLVIVKEVETANR